MLICVVQHTSENAPAELSAVVDELLNGLSAKFTSVSAEILTKSELASDAYLERGSC